MKKHPRTHQMFRMITCLLQNITTIRENPFSGRLQILIQGVRLSMYL